MKRLKPSEQAYALYASLSAIGTLDVKWSKEMIRTRLNEFNRLSKRLRVNRKDSVCQAMADWIAIARKMAELRLQTKQRLASSLLLLAKRIDACAERPALVGRSISILSKFGFASEAAEGIAYLFKSAPKDRRRVMWLEHGMQVSGDALTDPHVLRQLGHKLRVKIKVHTTTNDSIDRGVRDQITACLGVREG